MCEPEDPVSKVFTAGMFKIEPRVRVWEPTSRSTTRHGV